MTEPKNSYNPQEENVFNDFLQDVSPQESQQDFYDAEGEEDFYDVEGEEDYFGDDDTATVHFDNGNEEEENIEDYILDMDFSQFKGDFKSSLRRVNRTANQKKMQSQGRRVNPNLPQGRRVNPALLKKRRVVKKKIVRKPLTKRFGVGSASQEGEMQGGGATIISRPTRSGVATKSTKKIIVPSSQPVIVQGMDKLILNRDSCSASIKDVGYYRGKKLKELVFTMINNSGVDFTVELFNPSMPLDYLHSTSLNLNNKIQVAGGIVSYTDVLFNLLANPTHIPNAKFVFAGALLQQQVNQPLIFKNKNSEGKQKIDPLQLGLQVDTMQVASDIVFFNIDCNLNRPFIPNGMDVLEYTVLAGNTVTFAFYYEQKDLRKFFYKEARTSKKLL